MFEQGADDGVDETSKLDEIVSEKGADDAYNEDAERRAMKDIWRQ